MSCFLCGKIGESRARLCELNGSCTNGIAEATKCLCTIQNFGLWHVSSRFHLSSLAERLFHLCLSRELENQQWRLIVVSDLYRKKGLFQQFMNWPTLYYCINKKNQFKKTTIRKSTGKRIKQAHKSDTHRTCTVGPTTPSDFKSETIQSKPIHSHFDRNYISTRIRKQFSHTFELVWNIYWILWNVVLLIY